MVINHFKRKTQLSSDPKDARLAKQSKTKTPNCCETITVRGKVKVSSPQKTLSMAVE